MKKISEIKLNWFKYQIEVLKASGVTKADIARALCILPQYLNSITNGRRGVSDSFLDKFIEAYNINQIDLFNTSMDGTPDNESIKFFVNKIELQAKEIGRLEQEVEQLKKLEKNNIDNSNEDVRGVSSAVAG